MPFFGASGAARTRGRQIERLKVPTAPFVLPLPSTAIPSAVPGDQIENAVAGLRR